MNALSLLVTAVDTVKTEIALFLLAVFLHGVVFRSHSIPKKRLSKVTDCSSTKNSCKSLDGGAKGGLKPSPKLSWASVAENICKNVSGRRALADAIQNELQKVPVEERADALGSLLQGAIKSKVAGEDLLLAAHLLLEENGFKMSMALGECLMLGHFATGDVTKTQQAIEMMRLAGLKPKIATFNELLSVAVKKCPKHVWTMVDEMKKCNAKPDRITCAVLLKSLQAKSASADAERILKVLDDMDGVMDEVLLASLVEACLGIGRPDLLEPYLKKCTIKSVQLKSPHAYASIIRAYGFLKDIKGIWDTWREMRTRHILPTSVTLGCMVEALITNGDVEAGYDFIRDISKDAECCHQINAVIYGSVLKGFAQQKKFERVWSVYQEMLDLKLQFSIVTFNTLVDACARSREMNRIPALLESMVAQGIKPNLITYSAILKGYCQANRLDEAFQLVEQMSQTTELRPDEIMYNTLLDGCARLSFYDKGIKVLEEMQHVGVPPTNFTLSVLVKLACRCKRVDRAFELCDELSAKYNFKLNMHVYSNLVNGCAMAKDLPRAIGVLERMLSERVRPDARTYDSLLRACIADHRGQDAAGLLRAAMGLRGVHPKLVGKPANLFQPQGRLTAELVEHVLDGIAGLCKDPTLAVELLQDLRRVPGLRLDPKMQVRLASRSGRFD